MWYTSPELLLGVCMIVKFWAISSGRRLSILGRRSSGSSWISELDSADGVVAVGGVTAGGVTVGVNTSCCTFVSSESISEPDGVDDDDSGIFASEIDYLIPGVCWTVRDAPRIWTDQCLQIYMEQYNRKKTVCNDRVEQCGRASDSFTAARSKGQRANNRINIGQRIVKLSVVNETSMPNERKLQPSI